MRQFLYALLIAELGSLSGYARAKAPDAGSKYVDVKAIQDAALANTQKLRENAGRGYIPPTRDAQSFFTDSTPPPVESISMPSIPPLSPSALSPGSAMSGGAHSGDSSYAPSLGGLGYGASSHGNVQNSPPATEALAQTTQLPNAEASTAPEPAHRSPGVQGCVVHTSSDRCKPAVIHCAIGGENFKCFAMNRGKGSPDTKMATGNYNGQTCLYAPGDPSGGQAGKGSSMGPNTQMTMSIAYGSQNYDGGRSIKNGGRGVYGPYPPISLGGTALQIHSLNSLAPPVSLSVLSEKSSSGCVVVSQDCAGKITESIKNNPRANTFRLEEDNLNLNYDAI